MPARCRRLSCSRRCRSSGPGRSRCISAITFPACPATTTAFSGICGGCERRLSAPELEFFHSTYLFSPFGVDLINHPHTALQGYISATALARRVDHRGGESLHHRVGVPECRVRLRAGVRRRCGRRRAAHPRRRRVRRVAVRRRAPARALRSADGVGDPVVRAVSRARSLRTGSIAAGHWLRAVRGRGRVCRVLPRRVSRASSPSTYTLASWHAVRVCIASRASKGQALFTAAAGHHGV